VVRVGWIEFTLQSSVQSQAVDTDAVWRRAGVAPLDGMLFTNALHFVLDHQVVLHRLVNLLRPGGRVVIVEYDRRAASRWVPYSTDPGAWLKLAQSAGLESPRITARRPSVYAGELYVGVAERSSLNRE